MERAADGKFHCDLCKSKYAGRSGLKRHRVDKHPDKLTGKCQGERVPRRGTGKRRKPATTFAFSAKHKVRSWASGQSDFLDDKGAWLTGTKGTRVGGGVTRKQFAESCKVGVEKTLTGPPKQAAVQPKRPVLCHFMCVFIFMCVYISQTTTSDSVSSAK